MAIESVCGTLLAGQDISCAAPPRRYYQQAIIINKNDIDPDSVDISTVPTGTAGALVCNYRVTFSLKEGKTGYLFKGSEKGSTYKGSFDKTTNETFGTPDYAHHAQLIVAGVEEASKCILSSLDQGLYVVAFQFADGTIEMYGFEYGLTTDDYTFDTQDGGGGTIIVMSSLETSPERYLPLVYKSITPGSEVEDFDSLFANPVTP